MKMNAFLLDIFSKTRNGTSSIYGLGKLENGETFGFIDSRILPGYFSPGDGADSGSVFYTMAGEPVRLMTFPSVAKQKQETRRSIGSGVPVFNENITYPHQYLIARGIGITFSISGEYRSSERVDRVYENPDFSGSTWLPDFRVLSFDIETDGKAETILGISYCFAACPGGPREEGVFVLDQGSSGEQEYVTPCKDEPGLLHSFITLVNRLDPDIVTGWNVIDFDLAVLAKKAVKAGVPFTIGRSRDPAKYLESEFWGGSRMLVPGRAVLDAMHLVRGMSCRFDDFSLETVAQQLLGRGKSLHFEEWEKVDTIESAYRSDQKQFIEYALTDARLVLDILEQEHLIDVMVNKSILIGLPLQEVQSSVAPFEFLYYRGLFQRRLTGPSRVDRTRQVGRVAGGLVLPPVSGLYNNILVFDFKSLYPSIIRTFNIDPLAHVRASVHPHNTLQAPNGAHFSRERGILPDLIDRFFSKREEAKKSGNATASYTYKIIMNSFYGVLGTDSCSFSDPELAGAVTGFGQMLLTLARDYFEEEGFHVLYGDTDSLFTDCGLDSGIPTEKACELGRELARNVSACLGKYIEERYEVESRLEMEFEKFYRSFFLPPSRGGKGGSRAKSYAGLKEDATGESLEITGMEAVRSDWTPAARELQTGLLLMMFQGKSTEELDLLLSETVRNIRSGGMDDKLVYSKRLRKPLSSYTKTSPPHVKAARLLPSPVRTVRYVITLSGPQPLGFQDSPVDYDHYIQKQILPIAESLASFTGLSTAGYAQDDFGQQELF